MSSKGPWSAERTTDRSRGLVHELHADAESAGVAGDGAGGGGGAGGHIIAVIVHPLELEFQVGAEVPVQADGDAIHLAALDGVLAAAVVEINVRVACGQLDGAQTPVHATVFIADEPGVGERATTAEVVRIQ